MQQVSLRELDLAEARLGERAVRSPVDGVVTDRYVSVGERVEERALVRIATLHPLRVEVVLPNTLYGTVRPDMSADVQPDLPGFGVLRAKVTRVDKVLDAASNTFRVRLELPNANHAIPAGMRCKVSFGTGAPSAARADAGGLKLDLTLPALRPGTTLRPMAKQ